MGLVVVSASVWWELREEEGMGTKLLDAFMFPLEILRTLLHSEKRCCNSILSCDMSRTR